MGLLGCLATISVACLSTACVNEQRRLRRGIVVSTPSLRSQSAGCMHTYQMIELLHVEASLVAINTRMLSEGSTSTMQHSSYSKLHSRLAKLCRDEYADSNRSVARLLSACARARTYLQNILVSLQAYKLNYSHWCCFLVVYLTEKIKVN